MYVHVWIFMASTPTFVYLNINMKNEGANPGELFWAKIALLQGASQSLPGTVRLK